MSADVVKFMFSKKTTKIDEIFTVNLTLCQIDGEDFLENTNFIENDHNFDRNEERTTA